jgi:hypothetical protein
MVQTFATPRDAKEFLVSRIIAESRLEGVPLSHVETKMLYFSETAWTLPDIGEVIEAFDRECNQAEYEHKIGTLIRNLCANLRSNNRERRLLKLWAIALAGAIAIVSITFWMINR